MPGSTYYAWLEDKLKDNPRLIMFPQWADKYVPRTASDVPASVKLAMAFFGKIKLRGRPAFLPPDTESFVGEYLVGLASMGVGKDRKGMAAVLKQVSQAAGHPEAKGSRGHLQSFLSRAVVLDSKDEPAKIKVRKASNLSRKRAETVTPEKMGAQFRTMKAIYDTHAEQGRCENASGQPSGNQVFNTDEGHPGHAVYDAVGAARDADTVWRIVDGEGVEYHASTVITTIGTGHLVERLTGCIQQARGGKTAAGHLAENLPTGRNAPFFAATDCGGMTEKAFFKLATMFIHEVGKNLWEKDVAWDEQPHANSYGFERRPIYWLLDGHFSHTFYKTLQLLKDHDVHVMFTAAGGSEIDQVCDNGIMACVQSTS